MKEVKTYTFGDTVEEVKEGFVLLDPGTYRFTVEKAERGYHNGSANLPACDKAIVTFAVRGADGTAHIKENFFLAESIIWKVAQLFESLGMRKHGDPLKIDFDGAVGKSGTCKVTIEDWIGNDGKDMQSNRIEAYLEPSEPQQLAQAAFTPGKF